MVPGSPRSIRPYFAPSLGNVQALRALSCSHRVLTDSFLVPKGRSASPPWAWVYTVAGRDGPECCCLQCSRPGGLCHDHSTPRTLQDSAHSVNSMACPNKTLFVDTEVGILYHFQVPQNIILLTFEPFKNGNTALSLWDVPKQAAGGCDPRARFSICSRSVTPSFS